MAEAKVVPASVPSVVATLYREILTAQGTLESKWDAALLLIIKDRSVVPEMKSVEVANFVRIYVSVKAPSAKEGDDMHKAATATARSVYGMGIKRAIERAVAAKQINEPPKSTRGKKAAAAEPAATAVVVGVVSDAATQPPSIAAGIEASMRRAVGIREALVAFQGLKLSREATASIGLISMDVAKLADELSGMFTALQPAQPK